jgi:hypothetical protein
MICPFSMASVLTSHFSIPEDRFTIAARGPGVFSFTVACRDVASSILGAGRFFYGGVFYAIFPSVASAQK